MNIVIIAYYWPQLNVIGAHRPYWFAKYFADQGANVTVLTSRKYAYDGEQNLNLPLLDGVKVIEVDYATLHSKLVSLVFKTPFAKLAKSIYKKIFSNTANKSSEFVDPRGRWYEAAKGHVAALASEADVVISTFSPAECHYLGKDCKIHNDDILWVADYRDQWSGNFTVDKNAPNFKNILKKEQDTVCGYADLVTSTTDEMCDDLHQTLGIETFTITNGFDYPEEKVAKGIAKGKGEFTFPMTIVHTGSFYGGTRDPAIFMEALAKLRDENIISNGDVEVHFYGAYLDDVHDIKNNPRYRDFIKVQGLVTREEVMRVSDEADLLLLIGFIGAKGKGVATGKIYEYLSTGTPVIAVEGYDGVVTEILTNTGCGVDIKMDSESVADHLRQYFQSKKLDFYNPKLDEIMQYSRLNQSKKLWEKINEMRSIKD